MQPFSIVIPTYKEVNNLADLLAQIAAVNFGQRQFEVILVDDQSDDGSVETMQHLQTIYPWARMIVREGPRSLSRSVLLGCVQAKHALLISMDADLSHPIAIIPDMLQHLEAGHTEMVIGSRYINGGSVEEKWPLRRKLISRMCAEFTRLLLGLKIHDPLSGFFAVKQTTLQRGNITNPSGWKIALEIMIRCRCINIAEVPIHFADRRHGKSKLNARVGMAFIKQLTQLVYFKLNGKLSGKLT